MKENAVLNWYANTFRISEKNITKSGLLRTKIFAWLTLLIVPLETLPINWIEGSDNAFFQGSFYLFILVALVGLIGLLFSPLVHRFWAADQFLDEWEIEVKRKAMSAGYKVLFGALVIGLIYSSFTTDFSTPASAEVAHGQTQVDGVAFALLILAFGVQTLTQIRLIRPIDEDEVDTASQPKSPVWARIAVVVAILMLFFGAPFSQGVIDGLTDAPNNVSPATQSESDTSSDMNKY